MVVSRSSAATSAQHSKTGAGDCGIACRWSSTHAVSKPLRSAVRAIAESAAYASTGSAAGSGPPKPVGRKMLWEMVMPG